MPLDLAAALAVDLDYSCDLPLTDDQFRRIRSAMSEAGTDETSIAVARNIGAARRRYQEVAYLRKVNDTYRLWVRVGRAVARGFGKGKVEDLLEAIAPFGISATLECAATFQYRPSQWVSLVPLPLRLFELEAMPFDEVRGVRLVKLAQGRELAYSVIVDRPYNRNYQHVVTFAYEALIDASLSNRVVEEASRISRALVRPKRGS